MKNILTFILIIICSSAWSKNIVLESRLDFGLAYDSNINRLSDKDSDQFLNNEKPEKYLIKSLDDMILGMNYSLKLKNYWLGGHTQINELTLQFDKYLENSPKDNASLAYTIKQYFSRKLNLTFKYQFNPNIFLRQYLSVLDDEYHEFEYSKNGYSLDLNWITTNNLSFLFNLDYSQLFYSKWFTEYDADILTTNLYLYYDFMKNRQLEFRYGYRISEADADKAFSDPDNIDFVIKDASYIGNIFAANLKFQKIFASSTLNLRYTLQTRIYDSKFEGDKYHEKRDDYIHLFTTSAYKPLADNLSMIIKAQYGFRNTDSPYQNVKDDKQYEYWTSGITLYYDIKLK